MSFKKESRFITLWEITIINFFVGTPPAFIALFSRTHNIFNVNDHSYIEHFIYGVFGIPSFLALVMLFILTGNSIYKFFKRKENLKYSFKYNNAIYGIAIFLIILSYLSEYHREGNVVNHFNFDVMSIFIGTLIFSFIFKNVYIKPN
jgi:hypothetical protein